MAIGSTPWTGDEAPGHEGEQEGRAPADPKLYVQSATSGIFAQLIETDAASDEHAAVYAKRAPAVASHDATTWGALAYRDVTAQPWGVFTPGAAYVGATMVANHVQIPAGASDGYVLTSDMSGYASWQPPAAGFSLPYSGVVSYSAPAFKVGNTYVGENSAIEGYCFGRYGGYFTASRANNDTEAVHAEVTTTGNYQAVGVYGLSTPAENYGYGGYFRGGNKGVWGKAIANTTVQSAYYGVDGLVEGNYGYNYGVRGQVTIGDNINYGVFGNATAAGGNYGVYGSASNGAFNYAGYFNGAVHVNGTLSKSAGSFKIDHPLDPENMYLSHSFVESPGMMNIYNGNAVLDASGEAWVTMPDWFEALNRDFRYQLTAIGAPGPNLYVAEKIKDNRFKVSGGSPSMEISWQVTGVRHDAYAEAHRIPVEEHKSQNEQGRHLHPELCGRPMAEGLHQPVVHGEPEAPDAR